MRSEQRLNRIEQQVQAHFDRKVSALLPELTKWSEEDLNTALIAAYKADPRFVNNPAEVDRLFLPENEAEMMQCLRDDLAPETFIDVLYPQRKGGSHA